jgi:UDP-glucose 4-epimerase
MNILLAGSTGFIGRNMFEQLKGYSIFAPRSSELNLLNRVDLMKYVYVNRIDVILDCTCWNSYINPNKDRNSVLTNNIKMFFNLSCCSHLVKKVIYFGSGAELDAANWKPMMDESFFNKNIPGDDYGLSKYVNCLHAQQFSNIYNLRLFGVFGPYEDSNKRFISYCITRVLRRETIEMKQNCRFDYLYIDDLAKITDLFIRNDFHHRIYNVCSGNAIELVELANKVIQIVGNDVGINIKTPGFNREYSGDNSLLLKEIDFQFENIHKSIEKLAKWYRYHSNG